MALTCGGANRCSIDLCKAMEAEGIETVFVRHEEQQPQCKFGQQGICCRHCQMGPCRLGPVGKGAQRGVCGADRDTFAARGFVRAVASGTAAHSDHGRAVAELLIATAKGEAQGYQIKDERKLRAVAKDLGVKTDGRTKEQIAEEVGHVALAEFGKPHGNQLFLKRAPQKRQEVWKKHGVEPRAIDREITESLHRTGMGTDQEYKNLILQATRTALADGWGGSMIGTELQDILFGTPYPRKGTVNLGVLKADEVNIIVHGHEPILSEMIALAAQSPEMIKAAQAVGAKGITLAGICCTANELLIRHGIPVAGNMQMQELAIATGAVEAVIVDVQCIMQGATESSGRYHTKLITTSPKCKIPGAKHVEFDEHHALDTAKKIIWEAIDNYPNRKRDKMRIPPSKSQAVVGFSHETILYMLGGSFRSSYRPLNDNIMNGRIRGVAGVVGCTNPKMNMELDTYYKLVTELIANNILVVQTGCAAVQCAMNGLLIPEMQEKAGAGLREVCEAVGIPPVLHAGSCVDNSRILVACAEMVREGGLGTDTSDLPVAGACLEWMHEKALAIGHYFVASGVFTVFGINSPVSGSPNVQKYLTEEIEQELGGKWAFEPDYTKVARLIIDHIEKKRDALGINQKRERKLYDMEDRRKLTV